jgi:membrane protein YdbS with pleckstrin-like domain
MTGGVGPPALTGHDTDREAGRMGLPADQISPGERVVLELHEHWKHLLVGFLICLAALAGLIVILVISPSSRFLAWVEPVAWIAFAGVVLFFGVGPALAWWNRTYTLTTERLATRSGVIRRRGRDIPLTRVDDVAYEQGILDRVSGAGTLRVSAASEHGTVVLHDIPHVHAVALRMNELVRTNGGRG